MTVRELICDFDYRVIAGSEDVEYTELVTDSRKITKGCVFICIKGANFDGHSAALLAINKECAAVIVEDSADLDAFGLTKEVLEESTSTVISTSDTRYAMALCASAYYGYPSKQIKTIGITGTKGKTTTTYLIKSILEAEGHKVGLIGTIEVIIGDEHIKANNTTPESTLIQKYLRMMVDKGCDMVVMEVSSQGLMLHRTAGILFDIGIFTNLEPDHIGPNEHTSFEHYLECKSLLFRQCKLGIVNHDDEHSEQILKGHTCEVFTYGIKDGGNIKAEDIELYREGGTLGVAFDVRGEANFRAKIDMPGRFSVYNALTAIAVCLSLGADAESIKKSLLKAHVKGRIEMIKVSDDFTLMIDYAHNAMALRSLLETLREYNPGRLVTLFGCGGNRAKSRRYEMGEVSGHLSDFTIITSDNPRNEDPLAIMADIKEGMSKTDGKFVEIPDRFEAIKYAIHNGQSGDIIVLAGKGHEDYQEICGVKHHMDERELIERAVKELSGE